MILLHQVQQIYFVLQATVTYKPSFHKYMRHAGHKVCGRNVYYLFITTHIIIEYVFCDGIIRPSFRILH